MYFIGASGHAKVVIETWLACGGSVEGIFDDDPAVTQLFNYPVGHDYSLADFKKSKTFISIGSNASRKKLAERISGNYESIIHPGAIVSPSSTLGKGSILMAASVLNASVLVAQHVIINTSASVDHDCRLSDYVHVAPNAVLCGGVAVGEGSLVGAGATVIQDITIGRWAIIGAGSVITKDVPDYAVMFREK